MRWSDQQIGQPGEGGSTGELPGLESQRVRRFDAPEALDVRFHEVEAKSALNRQHVSSRMPFRWSVNPYRGCTHACVYCFARRTHRYLDLDIGRDFEREIIVKVNAPEVLRRELARPGWARELVALGTNTDPYQWVESRYRLMEGILAELRDAQTPVSIVTKSPLVLRDAELLGECVAAAGATVLMSVPTLDETTWRETEPHTPSPRKRIEAVAKLNASGVPAGVLVAPLMPGINDAPGQIEEIVAEARRAGAVQVGSSALHLKGEVRDFFFGWLAANRPDLVDRYEELYARGAYLSKRERAALETRAHRGRDRRREAAGARRRKRPPARGRGGPEPSSRPPSAASPETVRRVAPARQARLF